MCEANAYITYDNKEELILESVDLSLMTSKLLLTSMLTVLESTKKSELNMFPSIDSSLVRNLQGCNLTVEKKKVTQLHIKMHQVFTS